MNISDGIKLAAATAALAGGKAILTVYESDDFGIVSKADDSPLTRADREANDIIVKMLAQASELPIITEEIKASDYADRKGWQQLWMVDPLDGTKEFINRNGDFTVNIALIADGIPVFGVVYVPVSDELYLGGGQSAVKIIDASHKLTQTGTWSQFWSEGEALDAKVNRFNHDRPYRIAASKSHCNEETVAFIERMKDKFGNVELLSRGSSLKLCMVAEGRVDIYPRLGPTMEWDTAAAHAVATAAGCKVVAFDGGEALKYNKESLYNPFFIVSPQE
ncbi:MAG: 3'(2'),5'-bisphosphate nucleotidase CysQ [Victivallaceae bacterium]|nr:3'(2'),5'-bisphosphate nucleotidase CysQ [Victivallaceae bacterium]